MALPHSDNLGGSSSGRRVREGNCWPGLPKKKRNVPSKGNVVREEQFILGEQK
jgi:hypothetical protein